MHLTWHTEVMDSLPIGKNSDSWSWEEQEKQLNKLAEQTGKSFLLNFTATENDVEHIRTSSKRLVHLLHQPPDWKLCATVCSLTSSSVQQQTMATYLSIYPQLTFLLLKDKFLALQTQGKFVKRNSSNSNSFNIYRFEVVFLFKPYAE